MNVFKKIDKDVKDAFLWVSGFIVGLFSILVVEEIVTWIIQ